MEEDLYEAFVCWGKSVISQKEATNTAAASRIDMLEAYISDLENGRVELTTERTDLEKEIAGLTADIEAMDALRTKEHEDFLAAVDEMEKAIAALEKAIQVLSEATAEAKTGTLLSVRATLNEGFAARQADAVALNHAVEFGKKYLTKGDALFLERVLTGDVPVVDWKKLNRKATFKMKYKARSFKIQDVLSKLLETFEANLKEAEEKEAQANAEYEKLSAAKQAQLEKAQAALNEMAAENGAQGMAKEEAQAEVDALKTQIANDEKFIEQTKQALEEKKQEWKDRKALRAGEIAAINKAIAILNSDDARDLFKKSLASQGFVQLKKSGALLLQSEAGTTSATRMRNANMALLEAAKSSGDRRLLALATRTALKATGHFDDVITAIDKMIATLKEEAEADLKQKEECEKTRAEKARESALSARAIDEMTDKITKLNAEIKEIVAEVAEKVAAGKKIQEEMKAATELREKEKAEWVTSDAEDKAAAELVGQAKDVLEGFYKDNNLVLAQRREVPVVAGEAPPPPPTTWEAPYGGKTMESNGIVAIMEMIKEDIERDRAKAKAEEEEAQKEYDQFMEESAAQIKELSAAISELEASHGEKSQAVVDPKDERLSEKKNLDAVLTTLKDLAANCDYMAIHFPIRVKDRDVEIDGLIKAKSILQGAAYGGR